MNSEAIVARLADYTDPTDALAVTRLLDSYARDRMGAGAPLDPGVLERLVPELRRRPNAFSVLAVADGGFVGLTNCFEGFSTFTARPLVNIHDVYVVPDWRARGVGQAMLAEVESLGHAKGAAYLTLEVWEGNFIAQKAYRRFGFNEGMHDPELGGHLFWKKKLG